MIKTNKFTKVLLAVAVSAALTGCGGGGGGGGSSSSTSDQVNVAGTASKGIISGGVVIAEQLTADGVVELARTTTDSGGDYSLNLPASYNAADGAVRVRITAGDSTTMVCDAPAGCDGVAFGDPITLAADSGFEMAAVVTPDSADDAISVQITPFSHMAASAAGALGDAPGEVTSDSVATANATITALVGFDILNTDTSDLDNLDSESSSSETQYALLNAAIANTFFDGTASSVTDALTEGLEELAESLADGSLDADATGSDSFNIDTLQTAIADTISDVSSELSASDLDIDISDIEDAGDTVSNYQENIVDVTFADGLDPVEVTETENQSDVDAAKELIGNVRTLLQEIEATDFETPLDALGVDVETAEDIFSDESSLILQMVGDAIDSAGDALDTTYPNGILEALNADADKSISTTEAVTSEDGTALGNLTVTMTETSDGYSLVIAGTLSDGEKQVTVSDLTLTLSGATSFNVLEDSVADFITTDGVTAAVSGSITDGSTSITLNNVSLVSTLTASTTFTDGDDDTEVEDVINTLAFSGDVTLAANGATFTGTAGYSLVRLNDDAVRTVDSSELPLSLDEVSLSGTFTQGTKSFSASVELDIEGAATFDTFAFAEFETSPYVQFNEEDFDEQVSLELDTIIESEIAREVNPAVQVEALSFYEDFDGEGIWEYTFTQQGGSGPWEETAGLTDTFFADLDTFIYERIEAEFGSPVLDSNFELDSFLYVPGGNVYISGRTELVDFETSDSFLQGELTIDSSLTLPDMPAMRLVTKVERSSLNGGSVTITPYWGTETYTMTISSEDLDADTVAVQLSISDPVNVVEIVASTTDIDADELVGTVTVNGEEVATISDESGIALVRYSDGTFESLY